MCLKNRSITSPKSQVDSRMELYGHLRYGQSAGKG